MVICDHNIEKVKSVGIVPIKKENNQWKVFIIKHKAGHWGLPKGHSQSTENPHETAERELREETGLSVENYLPLEPLSFSYACISHGKNVYKTVTFFVATVHGEVVLCPMEIEESEWIDINNVGEKIKFMQMVQLLEQLGRLLERQNL